MAIILVASEIRITLELQLENLGHGLHVCESVVRCELQSVQLCVLAILQEMLEKLDVLRTRIVPVS